MIVTPAMLARFLSEAGLRANLLSERLYGDSVEPWPPTAETYEERPIYLVSSADAQKISKADAESRLFAVFAPSWPPEVPPALADRCLVACRFTGTAQEIADLANKQLQRFTYYLGVLSEEMANQDPIDKLVHAAATYLGMPVLLIDREYSLIARSDAEPAEPPELWRTLVGETFSPEDPATGELLRKIGDHFSQSNLPLHLVTKDGCRVLACNVFRPASTFGYVLLFGGKRRIDEATRDFTTIICSSLAASIALAQQPNQQLVSRSEALLAGAVNGSVEDAEALERFAAAAGWHFGPFFQMAILGVPGEATSETFMQRLARQFSEVSSALVCASARGAVACLFSSEHSEVIGPTARRQIEGFARANNLRAGLSRSYDTFLETAHRFDQAIVAVEQGMARNPKGLLFLFSDFTFSYLKDILSARESLYTFCHPGVLALAEYDETHSSQLTETVSCYLENGKSPSKTAAALAIHRSTLDYRIKHAEEIMGVSLSVADDHFDVWFSLRLLRDS